MTDEDAGRPKDMRRLDFLGEFKFLRYVERVEQDSEKGQSVSFKAILRDKLGRRVTVLSATPFEWRPGQRVSVKIRLPTRTLPEGAFVALTGL